MATQRSKDRLNVLVISDLFPNPAKPAFGIFVERQTTHVQAYCNNVVVVPLRIFPHLRLWKQIHQPKRVREAWQRWQAELAMIPDKQQINGIPVYYPRYTSLPKQLFHATWGFFAYPFLMGRLRELHKKYSFDLIHAHYAAPAGVIALLAQRWLKIPIVLSVHGTDVTYTAKQHAIGAAIIRWVFKNVDIILANSTWTAKQIAYYGGDLSKIETLFLAGDSPPSVQVTEPAKQKGALTLLSVGYLERLKGNSYVLQALRRLLDMGYALRYVIVGDGPERQNFERITKELNLEAYVSFEGYKKHSEVWPYFAACDIFVLPSWIEPFGIVYIEALGLGKPVIACEGTGGPTDIKRLCPECIELVKQQDVNSLVQALKSLIEDPEKRAQMGALGQQLVADKFTWQRNAELTQQIYKQVLEWPKKK